MKPSGISVLARFVRAHRRTVATLFAGLAVYATIAALSPPSELVTVVVATRPLVGGTRIAAEDVAVQARPAEALPDEYVTDAQTVIGRVVTVSLPRNTPLHPTSVVSKATLAAPGMVVIPVSLSASSAGLVEVGDRIDLIGTPAEADGPGVMAHQVRVVALVSAAESDSPLGGSSSGGAVVLVEVNPSAAARLVAVATRGPMGFALR